LVVTEAFGSVKNGKGMVRSNRRVRPFWGWIGNNRDWLAHLVTKMIMFRLFD